jgi:nucleotide-binding universal stress UspA family protein
MKNILLLVHDDAGQEARLQAALDVTRAVDGHLECLDITEMPLVFDALDGASAAMMIIDDEVAQEKANRHRLETRLAGEGVQWSWTDAVGNIAELVVERSGLVDLIVLNRRIGDPLSNMRGIAGAIVTRAQRPVLTVAEDVREFNPRGRALIAWDGSAAATAALQKAIPLLTLASEVRLLHIAEGGEEADLSAAALYLSRHGIHADVKQVIDEERPVAQAIADEIASWGADWLVMGAYDHSRLREALFGGTTRQVLTNCSVPTILAH